MSNYSEITTVLVGGRRNGRTHTALVESEKMRAELERKVAELEREKDQLQRQLNLAVLLINRSRDTATAPRTAPC